MGNPELLNDDIGNPEYSKAICMLTNTLNQKAQKLRISNSARIHRHSGKLEEPETRPIDDDPKGKTLFGSNVIRLG